MTQKCQILSRDTLVENEQYVVHGAMPNEEKYIYLFMQPLPFCQTRRD